MKNTTAILLVIILAAFLGAASSFAQCQGCKDACAMKVESEVKGITEVKTEPNQATCPVMGEAINKEIYADHEGQRVYFCCASCVDAFKADPDKYLKQMKKDGVVPDKAPCENCASGKPCEACEGEGEHKHKEGEECESCKEKHAGEHEGVHKMEKEKK